MVEWKDAPVTPHFILNHDWPAAGKPALYLPTLKNYPLTAYPVGDNQGPEIFRRLNWLGAPPRPKKYPPITGRLITYMHVQNWSLGFIVQKTVKHVLIRLLEFTWWLLLVRLANVKLPPYFGVYSLAVGFWCGYTNATLGRTTVSLEWAPDKASPFY